MMFSLWL
jgi:hypothetical protein